MTEPNHKQATLHDVARLANVSHQTVSRVINQSPNVADETRERVTKAIEILNYRPNRAARSLITGRSQTIQIIDFEATYVTPIPTIVSVAGEMGYRTGISILRQSSAQELYTLLDELTSWMVDGIVLFDPQMHLDAQELYSKCRGIPFILMGGEPSCEAPSVVFDQADGMNQILDHLYALGHRKIAEMSGPQDVYDGRARHEAYMDWMCAHGLEPGPWIEGGFGLHKSHRLAGDLLAAGEFSAVVCGNDVAALGVLRAFQQRGLRIPADFSMVGFDDHPHAQFFDPPLTTVRQDYSVLSRAGIVSLLARIENPDLPGERLRLRPQLIVRESTQPIV